MMSSAISASTPRKQRIYEEAARLFHFKGYRATSMRDLAASVQLEPSSLYSHIKSKEELLKTICFDCGARFQAVLNEIVSNTSKPTDQLQALVLLHVNTALNDVTATTVFNDEWRHLTEPYFSEFIAMRKSYTDMCVRIVQDGIAAARFRNLDPHIVVNTLLSSVLWLQRSQKYQGSDTQLVADTIFELVFGGLKTTNSPI